MSHNFVRRRTHQRCLVLLAAWCLVGRADSCRCQDAAAIRNSLAKGSQWLTTNLKDIGDPGEQALAALALVKSGTPTDAPFLPAIVATIQNKIKNAEYRPAAHFQYEACVDAMLLVEIDPDKYQPELTAIRTYIVQSQLPGGGWTYSSPDFPGDTSLTQYACLGLWAVTRAGLDVPVDVWDRVLAWHARVQNQDGGFCYRPVEVGTYDNGASGLNMTTAAIGSMMIAARHAFPGRADSLNQLMQRGASGEGGDPAPKPPDDGNPLVKIDLAKTPEPEPTEKPTPMGDSGSKANLEQVRNTVARALGWLTPRFIPIRLPSDGGVHHLYYIYTVERTFSLTGQTAVGKYNWYPDGSAALIQLQSPNGAWETAQQHTNIHRDTCFSLLFLSRSTGKLLHRTTTDPTYGGGLLTGGKGDPTTVVSSKKNPTPLDQLLQSLQNPGALDLEEAQSNLLDQIQLGDRTALVGQKDLLVDLIQHPTNGEVRRTAAWALGRTNDLHLARYLIDALEDPELGVAMEAHAALCWLSRRFDGYGLAANPLDTLDAAASEQVQATAIHGWRVRARREWGNWYLRVRPYADRGDEFEARLKQRMGEK